MIMKSKVTFNKTGLYSIIASVLVVLAFATTSFARVNVESNLDGDGHVAISGELRQWHDVTLNLSGPFCSETDTAPNPFTDYRFHRYL